MHSYMTVKEASKKWNISSSRITKLCRESRIEGAYKKDNTWFIPSSTLKPIDQRVKDLAKPENPSLPLPIGISDYRLATSNYYYIDKTLLIKEILDERANVSLFTRPRRFGKTLNMDMLRTFFEKTAEDTSVYFKSKKIWQEKKYREYQGKYPVIFVTFKDIKFDTWEDTFYAICDALALELGRHKELQDNQTLNIYEKNYIYKIMTKEASLVELSNYFSVLSNLLHQYHGIAPIIIIDEYDIPIQQGYLNGFYDQIILFMRNLFSGAFKDNSHLSFGFLTGVLRVAKESIFSGLNNLKINSILDKRYSEYFGFTTNEVQELLTYYNVSDKYDELCEWYDGYRFGNTDIFNPWSVINYLNNECLPKAYWQFTGNNDIIGKILHSSTPNLYQQLSDLLEGKTVSSFIDTSVIYPEIINNPSSIYSFLLVAGYLKVIKGNLSFTGDYICELAIPNKEITYVYQKEILSQLSPFLPSNLIISIQEALYTLNTKALKQLIQQLLMQSVSFYDTLSENFYHGLLLGLCAVLNEVYVTSNRESGLGRYDLRLMPLSKELPGIIIEIKYDKQADQNELKELSQKALNQIHQLNYESEMTSKGVQTIYKYGVAFSGKNVEISTN